MKDYRTIRYRLHPNTQGKAKSLLVLSGACRHIWNHFVAKLRDDYEFYGECDFSWYSNNALLTVLRNGQKDWLQDYSAAIVRQTLKPIEVAYQQFFKGTGGRLPRFHGRYSHNLSFTCPAGTFKLNNKSLHIQKIGQVGLSGLNPYPDGKPVQVTVKQQLGNWYAYVVYEVVLKSEPRPIREVGIDRNVGQITCSDRVVYRLPDDERGRMLECRKKRYQRMVARRVKGSNHRSKAKRLLGKTCQKIAKRRYNGCHHTSKAIADKYTTVYMEDLNTKGMTKAGRGKNGLNCEILRSGWYQLEQMLAYKTNVIKVPAAYTSQRCHECGHTEKDNRKTQAEFVCQACGHRDNADCNAALNILAFGNGAAARGGGVEVRRPVKREIDREVGFVN